MGSLYLDLAQRLRAVKASRSERADLEREQSLQAGGVPLDSVLNFLDTQSGHAVVEDIRQKADAALASLGSVPTSPFTVFASSEDAFLPNDPLLRNIARFFDERCEQHADPILVPRAIVTVLAMASTAGGVLSEQAVEQKLGSQGASLFRLICKEMGTEKQSVTRPKLKFQELDHAVSDKVARSRGRETFAARMPLLAEVTHSLGGQGALRGFTMASVQHLFPSTAALYDALEDNGAERISLGIGGKNYSSNADMTARLQADGFDVHPDARPRPEGAGLNSEVLVYEMAKSELRRLFDGVDPKRETKPRFLLLDEGGKLIKALHKEFPAYAHLCVAVEQTDRGIQIVEALAKEGVPLRCPVVNSARSVTKKNTEAPMIGESIVFHTEHELKSINPSLEVKPKIATIIGYGSVGKATADALKQRGFAVFVYDIDPAKMEQANADGCRAVPRNEALKQAHLLYSCTGVTAVKQEDYALLPDGAVLVNAASGNHELDLHQVPADFFDKADSQASTDASQTLHSTFRGAPASLGDKAGGEAMLNRVLRTKDGKELLIVRSGYVVNMTLGLPPEYVQMELSLLLASCLQAVKETEPGLRDVAQLTQAFVVRRMQTHMKRIGHSLTRPNFRSLPSWQL